MGPSRRRTDLLLVALLAYALLLSFGSDALLVRSERFWAFCERHATTRPTRPLAIEAELELLDAGDVDVLVMGNSVAFTDVSTRRLAMGLRLPPHRVTKTPMNGATATELSMLTPHLERIRPLLVVYLATAWELHPEVDVPALRLYDPGVAWSLFTPAELFRERSGHASHLLGSQHVVIRHRDALRRVLHRVQYEWVTGEEPHGYWRDDDDAAERRALRDAAETSDFGCPSPHTRALDLMGERLAAHGMHLVVVATPARDRHGGHDRLRKRLDACLIQSSQRVGYHYFPYSSLREVGRGRFRDKMHLNREGKREFTDELAAHLAPLLWSLGREE